jgi:ParB-like chromosome segregation protein Spo0J
MEKMKVKVKELKANPFRDLENYPFNMEKIEKLKKSIEQTGFWDNILARQVNGQIQIAYGHHRLKALQEVYSPDYMVEVPIKDLSDELMLKIMANENMEEWQSSVAVIDETVRAVRGFLSRGTQISANQIANFLSWPLTRINPYFWGDE